MSSRSTNRGGLAPLLTATQLGALLPLPLLMVTEGHAVVKFPFSTRATPSLGVLLQAEDFDTFWVNYAQWEKVAIPLLEGGQLQSWVGKITDFGSAIKLASAMYGASRTEIFAKGTTIGITTLFESEVSEGLYTDDTTGFLKVVGPLVYKAALAAGYK